MYGVSILAPRGSRVARWSTTWENNIVRRGSSEQRYTYRMSPNVFYKRREILLFRRSSKIQVLRRRTRRTLWNRSGSRTNYSWRVNPLEPRPFDVQPTRTCIIKRFEFTFFRSLARYSQNFFLLIKASVCVERCRGEILTEYIREMGQRRERRRAKGDSV